MILRVGTMVLLYRTSSEELYNANSESLITRLYKVVSLGKDGRVILRHHQEARAKKDLGNMVALDDNKLDIVMPHTRISYTKLNALIQGQDFELTDTGKIVFN